jgi:hypothetical protein
MAVEIQKAVLILLLELVSQKAVMIYPASQDTQCFPQDYPAIQGSGMPNLLVEPLQPYS